MEYRKFATFIDSVQYGYTADETSTVEGDAKYLRITDIVPYFVDKDRVPFCKIDNKNKAKYLVSENDLLIARTGATTGYNLIVPKGFENYIFASYLVRFNYRQNELYPQYLKHVLKSQQYYGFVKNFIGGSAQPGMNPKAFGKFEVPYMEYDAQKQIANILSTYDNLIENNNKRIAILEQMAENLYKEWFVRFRFPGYETAEFENGIPKGWRVVPVKEAFEIFDTERIPVSSMDRDKMQKIYPYYGAAELMDYVDDYLFDGIYLLLGEDGSVITPKGKPVLQYVWGKFWVNNHAHVLQGKYPFSTEYLHLMFGQMDITGIVTGAAQPKISQGRLFKKKTILPTEDLVVRFDSIIQPIYQKIRKLSEANNNLKKQRDLLLPRLMSGKLEV